MTRPLSECESCQLFAQFDDTITSCTCVPSNSEGRVAPAPVAATAGLRQTTVPGPSRAGAWGDLTQVGPRLESWRRQRRRNQRELAQLSSVSVKRISAIEHGDPPTAAEVVMLAQALGVAAVDLDPKFHASSPQPDVVRQVEPPAQPAGRTVVPLRETVGQKAHRLRHQDRVVQLARAEYAVAGDHGDYIVRCEPQGWTCTCPATVDACSHILAAGLLAGEQMARLA